MQTAVAMSPAGVLRLLADTAAVGERPVVSVHLSGGQILDGMLLKVGADRGSDVVVLASTRTGQLGYALLAHVIAVEVRNPESFQDVITAGLLPLPTGGEPVTRLGLQREFAPTEDFPVRVAWAAWAQSALMLANLASLLRGLREAVSQVRADEMGTRAWEQVHALQVEHRGGSPLSVERIPEGLSVHADLAAALPRALDDDLFRKISALL